MAAASGGLHFIWDDRHSPVYVLRGAQLACERFRPLSDTFKDMEGK